MHRPEHLGRLMIAMAVVGGLGAVHRPAVGQIVPATSATRSLLNLGLAAAGQAGSIRYGGTGSASVSSSWRALPSEQRYNRMASGMLPSEVRGASMATGSNFFGGRAAQVSQRTPGTLRYSNPYRSPYATAAPPRGAITPHWSRPSSPLVSSTRPLGTSSLTHPFTGVGTIHHGGAAMSSPLSRPMTAAPYVPRTPGTLASLTRPLGASTTTRSFGVGGCGTIRYGGY